MDEGSDPASFLVPAGLGDPVIVRGKGAEVFDEAGRSYLDLDGGPGVASVGHAHPRVADAIADQAKTLLQAPGRYYTRQLLQLARRLAALTGGRLRRSFFANSGAEANEGSIKLALRHGIRQGKRGLGILALEHGFHGRLSLPLALTGMAQRKRDFGPFATFPGVVHVPAPYCYRCPLGLTYPACGVRCADVVEDRLKTSVPGDAALMIAEPIPAVGGMLVPPDEYWPKVASILRRHDITLVHDEVFTGFGRTGRMFAHEHWGTEPEVVSFAKAIGGGVPLGGFLATEELGTAFEPGDHFTTFGPNNQLGIRAANTVLDILEDEALPERADQMGKRFVAGFRELAGRHEGIGDVRGRGLLIGVEIVKDRTTREPDPGRAKWVQGLLKEQRVLVTATGVHECVLRITPPLVIDEHQVDRALEAFDLALAKSEAV